MPRITYVQLQDTGESHGIRIEGEEVGVGQLKNYLQLLWIQGSFLHQLLVFLQRSRQVNDDGLTIIMPCVLFLQMSCNNSPKWVSYHLWPSSHFSMMNAVGHSHINLSCFGFIFWLKIPWVTWKNAMPSHKHFQGSNAYIGGICWTNEAMADTHVWIASN